ncbi:hypothetical protein H9X85_03890 [Anaerotignum lactatifermentans]|uniref:DUF2313 domain-containing protein n=1 Tax=Anaerotignum lactatifermentans TaxID=160404 RepID=A0ABS2G9C4_9FIRM|nr:putative phage tail protein [Anaerotignum lactatifermentans]MBM6828772.1 hypothetical protein [Anaerotignum lactatifermentans]MBM6877099.1 hypothetical protein [Anaerotignum lactatifermentans]MBM6950354.1 hypothetical protein [Anaerotignum lactatifermentans]
MENRYEKYVPPMLLEYAQFRKLAELEGGILEEEAQAKAETEQSQWILTSCREGLLRRAAFMGLRVEPEEEIEKMRERVLSYWSSRTPYTYFMVLDWLDGYCGETGYQAEIRYDQYLLKIVLRLAEKEKRAAVYEWLRSRIPANIVLEVLLDVNPHRKVGWLTHGQLKQSGWTYGQIPYEDLAAYERKKE